MGERGPATAAAAQALTADRHLKSSPPPLHVRPPSAKIPCGAVEAAPAGRWAGVVRPTAGGRAGTDNASGERPSVDRAGGWLPRTSPRRHRPPSRGRPLS